MTDTVRCSVDSNHAITCEVDIGPEEPTASPPVTSPPAPSASVVPSPVSASGPAVAGLVDRFSSQLHPVRGPTVPLVTLDTAEQCLGPVVSLGLAAFGSKSTLMTAGAAFKASLDLGACAAQDRETRQATSNYEAALLECEINGGSPTEFINHVLTCEVPVRVTP